MKETIKEVASAMVEHGVGKIQLDITTRDGAALELQEPVKLVVDGVISAPYDYISSRKDTFILPSHILVNRDERCITLYEDEANHYGAFVRGKLKTSREIDILGINSGKYMTTFEMADLIKFNRAYFDNRTEAMKLVNDLQNFKAKVSKEIELSDNNRGDRRELQKQIVSSNIPQSFKLRIPLFKGGKKTEVECEIYIKADDLTCCLVSAELNELVEDSVNDMIDDQLEQIRKEQPQITIMEV